MAAAVSADGAGCCRPERWWRSGCQFIVLVGQDALRRLPRFSVHQSVVAEADNFRRVSFVPLAADFQ
ncbi:hypothetical protein ACVXG8_00580 [Escherichia coli]